MIFYRVVLVTQTSIDTQDASITAKPFNSYQAIFKQYWPTNKFFHGQIQAQVGLNKPSLYSSSSTWHFKGPGKNKRLQGAEVASKN